MSPFSNTTDTACAGASGPELTLAERQAFVEFDADDARLLQRMGALIAAELDTVIQHFYAHVMAFGHLQTLLGDSAVLQRVQQAQRLYFERLCSGQYDEAYVQNRLHIGNVHERVGLEPFWYIGAYRKYAQELLEAYLRCETDAGYKAPTAAALFKLISIDIALAMEAYGGAQMARLQASHAQLQFQRLYDGLTGLPNLALFADRLAQTLVHARRMARRVAVLMIDVDHFGTVNDSLGPAVGDALLCALARRLSHALRPDDTVARHRGDSFIVALSDVHHADDAVRICDKLHAACTAAFDAEGHQLFLSISIGVTMAESAQLEVDGLPHQAEAAMRRAKALGRNRTVFYADAINAQVTQRLLLQNGLHEALARGQLELHYQPQYDLERRRIGGVEALLRWRHPDLGWIPPLQFIPVAEEAGYIAELTGFALRTACAALARWRSAGYDDLQIAVNLSPRQFDSPGLPAMIDSALQDSGLPASALELEITESAVLADLDSAVRLLQRLRARGIRIAMDDFGTGYSSLANLRALPLDCLKIDRSFVQSITENAHDGAIVRAIFVMARHMGQRVVVEGVETEAQYALLARMGCQHMQGYWFAKPMAESALIQELHRPSRLPAAPSAQRYLLVVDDEAGNRHALARALRGEAFSVLTAANAAEAFAALALHPVGVVLCDQRMPGLSGVEFLQRVRRQYPELVRIVLTGYTGLDSVIAAVNDGAVYKFLTKPWDDEQLRMHLREAFRVHELAAEVQQLRARFEREPADTGQACSECGALGEARVTHTERSATAGF